MKKFTSILLLAVVIMLTLGACLPVDGEPEGAGAGMAGEGEVSRTASEEPYEPEKIEGWGDDVSSFAACSWNGRLLEYIREGIELDGVELGELWWINDEPVSELYSEDVFADGVCYDGVFRFDFNSRQEEGKLAALAGLDEDELHLWAREWSWPNYMNMARSWELAVTYKPLPEGKWVTPGWWLPPEGLTGKGEDMYGYSAERAIAGPFDADGKPIPTPEPTPFPEDRQAAEDFRLPAWEPVEGHEGYEMSTVHSTADGRPLQVRLRWKNDEGFGFWAQLPAYAVDSFWEHEDEWFIKVTVSGEGRESGNSGSSGTDAVSSQRGDDSSWYADNYLLESSPAYDDEEELLADLFRATEQDEYWWLDGETADKIVRGDMQEEPEGDNWVNSGVKKGLVRFEYRAGETIAYPINETDRYEFYVTALPGGEAPVPDGWEVPDDEWGTPENHPGFRMAVVKDGDGAPISVILRWQEDGYWFIAGIPSNRLDAFWENYESLFVKRDRSSVQSEG